MHKIYAKLVESLGNVVLNAVTLWMCWKAACWAVRNTLAVVDKLVTFTLMQRAFGHSASPRGSTSLYPQMSSIPRVYYEAFGIVLSLWGVIGLLTCIMEALNMAMVAGTRLVVLFEPLILVRPEEETDVNLWGYPEAGYEDTLEHNGSQITIRENSKEHPEENERDNWAARSDEESTSQMNVKKEDEEKENKRYEDGNQGRVKKGRKADNDGYKNGNEDGNEGPVEEMERKVKSDPSEGRVEEKKKEADNDGYKNGKEGRVEELEREAKENQNEEEVKGERDAEKNDYENGNEGGYQGKVEKEKKADNNRYKNGNKKGVEESEGEAKETQKKERLEGGEEAAKQDGYPNRNEGGVEKERVANKDGHKHEHEGRVEEVARKGDGDQCENGNMGGVKEERGGEDDGYKKGNHKDQMERKVNEYEGEQELEQSKDKRHVQRKELEQGKVNDDEYESGNPGGVYEKGHKGRVQVEKKDQVGHKEGVGKDHEKGKREEVNAKCGYHREAPEAGGDHDPVDGEVGGYRAKKHDTKTKEDVEEKVEETPDIKNDKKSKDCEDNMEDKEEDMKLETKSKGKLKIEDPERSILEQQWAERKAARVEKERLEREQRDLEAQQRVILPPELRNIAEQKAQEERQEEQLRIAQERSTRKKRWAVLQQQHHERQARYRQKQAEAEIKEKEIRARQEQENARAQEAKVLEEQYRKEEHRRLEQKLQDAQREEDAEMARHNEDYDKWRREQQDSGVAQAESEFGFGELEDSAGKRLCQQSWVKWAGRRLDLKKPLYPLARRHILAFAAGTIRGLLDQRFNLVEERVIVPVETVDGVYPIPPTLLTSTALIRIFDAVVDSYANLEDPTDRWGMTQAALTLGAVCAPWRKRLHSYSRLWARIANVDYYLETRDPALLTFVIHLAKTSDLHLAFSHRHDKNPGGLVKLLLLSTKAEQIKSIWVDSLASWIFTVRLPGLTTWGLIDRSPLLPAAATVPPSLLRLGVSFGTHLTALIVIYDENRSTQSLLTPKQWVQASQNLPGLRLLHLAHAIQRVPSALNLPLLPGAPVPLRLASVTISGEWESCMQLFTLCTFPFTTRLVVTLHIPISHAFGSPQLSTFGDKIRAVVPSIPSSMLHGWLHIKFGNPGFHLAYQANLQLFELTIRSAGGQHVPSLHLDSLTSCVLGHLFGSHNSLSGDSKPNPSLHAFSSGVGIILTCASHFSSLHMLVKALRCMKNTRVVALHLANSQSLAPLLQAMQSDPYVLQNLRTLIISPNAFDNDHAFSSIDAFVQLRAQAGVPVDSLIFDQIGQLSPSYYPVTIRANGFLESKTAVYLGTVPFPVSEAGTLA